MKIAVTSQNRKDITGHAGKCRKFWLYDIEHQQVQSKQLIELPLDQSFHEVAHATTASATPHPLDGIQVLIAGGMGQGLQNRLKHKGIRAVATSETQPDQAVAAWLAGTLVEIDPESHEGGDHHHDDDHHHHDHAGHHPTAVFVAPANIGKFNAASMHPAALRKS